MQYLISPLSQLPSHPTSHLTTALSGDDAGALRAAAAEAHDGGERGGAAGGHEAAPPQPRRRHRPHQEGQVRSFFSVDAHTHVHR